MQEPELQEFAELKSVKGKLSYQVSDAVRSAVNRFVIDQDFHAQGPQLTHL